MRFWDEQDAMGRERGDLNHAVEIQCEPASVSLQIDLPPSYTGGFAASNHSELLDRAGQ